MTAWRSWRAAPDMTDWLNGLVALFAGSVPDAIRQLVQWAVHGLAGVVLGVFGRVTGSWGSLADSFSQLGSGQGAFTGAVFRALAVIVRHDFPGLWRALTAAWRQLKAALDQLGLDLAAAYRAAIAWTDHAVADTRAWALAAIFSPLALAASWAHDHLLAWAFPAWQLVTHPGDLAQLLLRPLIAALEAAAWDLAPGLGEFFTALAMRNLRRVAQVIETVLTAVL